MIVEREWKRSGSRCVTVPIRALQVATLPDRDATDSAVRGRNIAGARGAHADGTYMGTCGGERLGHVRLARPRGNPRLVTFTMCRLCRPSAVMCSGTTLCH